MFPQSKELTFCSECASSFFSMKLLLSLLCALMMSFQIKDYYEPIKYPTEMHTYVHQKTRNNVHRNTVHIYNKNTHIKAQEEICSFKVSTLYCRWNTQLHFHPYYLYASLSVVLNVMHCMHISFHWFAYFTMQFALFSDSNTCISITEAGQYHPIFRREDAKQVKVERVLVCLALRL